MNDRADLKRRIHELDFAIHELSLFLDTHPTNRKAMELLAEYHRRRQAAVSVYESRFGQYVVTSDQLQPTNYWSWVDGPWPWEINFMEAQN